MTKGGEGRWRTEALHGCVPVCLCVSGIHIYIVECNGKLCLLIEQGFGGILCEFW